MEVQELTEEQLEQQLADLKKKKAKEAQAKRQKYEQEREHLVNDLIIAAETNHEVLLAFKQGAFAKIQAFHKQMLEYGDVPGKSKGGFSLKTEADDQMVTYAIQQNKAFDERADMAEEKLMQFLESFVKKRDKRIYKLVMSLLERTKTGDFDVNLIQRLYKMENDFDHPDWVEAIRLFKEAYNATDSTTYMTFKKRDELGNWNTIQLNFSSLRV